MICTVMKNPLIQETLEPYFETYTPLDTACPTAGVTGVLPRKPAHETERGEASGACDVGQFLSCNHTLW
jgi:hypothetical protein